ncbi:AfsR/SARP family transcriptional regulator [[Actinomadura] parvosata]|uniref:AfsR/SARP family transcriptional regulator n=1 Tax=[Actinomadura] parvosata TaxID=1955412 RepID=UPI00164522FF|nr:AfsR/SARP family transcriptional regulator [Nonomuraea sp. ATCC 55076]
MRFSVLGQISVQDEAPIEIPRTRRPLLATLLLAWPDEVAGDLLMEAVWGEAAGRDNSLKTALSQLRRLLPGRVPPARGHGYRIELQPHDSLDVEQFRRLAQQGHEHIAAGNHAEAVACLRQALQLWGDPPLADVPDDPVRLASWRTELLWERKVSQQALLESRLLLGEGQQLLGDIRRELIEDPLSEPLNALLMTALYRAGYRVEALRQYETIARLLARDTGTEPGAQLRHLRDQIAADRLPPTGPSSASASTGRLPSATSVQARDGLPLAQLPTVVTDFTGRTAEIDQLVAHLSGPAAGVPIAAVWGPPGVGKSTLAHQAAHLLRPVFGDGQLYVHMAGTSDRPRDTAEVLGEVLTALGVPPAQLPATVSSRTALYRSLLADRRVLVVLDDVCGMHQAHPLLPGTPGCAVLLTSRPHLVGMASIRSIRLGPLTQPEALSLLGDIIGAERVQAEPAAAADIAALCSGLPLAVRVAGARLSAQQDWPLRTFADQLSRRRMSMLATDEVAVEASISDSYEALPERARRIFRLASLLGSAGFASWEVAMLEYECNVEEVERILDALTRQSLLTTVPADTLGQLRYRQHDLLRAYAADRLAALPDERDVAIYRLLLGWLELVCLADAQIVRAPCHPPMASTFTLSGFAPAPARTLIMQDADRWLAAEMGNLLNVVRVACDQQLYLHAMGLALRVSSYLCREGRHDDAEHMWRRVLQAVAPVNARWAAEARYHLAHLIVRQPSGAYRALPLLDQCVSVWETLSDRHGAARSLALRSTCWHHLATASDLGDRRAEHLAKAEADAKRALGLARTTKNAHEELLALRALALALSDQGRHGQALDTGGQALAVAARLAVLPTHQTYLVLALLTQGQVLLAAHRAREALDAFERAARLSEQARHRAGQARAEEGAGDALTALSRHDRAGQRYAQAAVLCEAEGRSEHAARCRAKLPALSSPTPANC